MSTKDGLLRAVPKDVSKMIRKARKQGWTVQMTRGNHLRWDAPDGGDPVFTAQTPRDRRNLTGIRKRLKAAGLKDDA